MKKENVLNEFVALQGSKKQLIVKAKRAIYKFKLTEVEFEFSKIPQEALELQKGILEKEVQLINYEHSRLRAQELQLAEEYAKLHGEAEIDDPCRLDYLVLLHDDTNKLED